MLRKLIAVLFVIVSFNSNVFAAAPDLRPFYSDHVSHKKCRGDFTGAGVQLVNFQKLHMLTISLCRSKV